MQIWLKARGKVILDAQEARKSFIQVKSSPLEQGELNPKSLRKIITRAPVDVIVHLGKVIPAFSRMIQTPILLILILDLPMG